MNTLATDLPRGYAHPVEVQVVPATENRDRLTVGFRLILAIPHLLLVGGPIALGLSWPWAAAAGERLEFGSGGVLGAVAATAAVIGWFSILFTARYPEGLWNLAAFYMRWRVRVLAYTTLLRDEYPPFGEGDYPVAMELQAPEGERDRLTVAFRIVLALPHILVVWVLGIAWALTTVIAWFSILFTGRYPAGLYGFAVGTLRWSTRVESYVLLLHDEYPPFAFE
jgi:hypothetical protein